MPGKTQPIAHRGQKRIREAGEPGWSHEADDSTLGINGVPTLEATLYGAAIAVGIALRLLMLDARPLSVDEGGLASQAYRIMLGQFGGSLEDGPLPTYGTAMFLALFAAGDGAARMLSVIAGSALIASPLLVKKELGRRAAIVTAWGFALSPLLLYASRTVGSGILPAALSMGLWWSLESSLSGRWRPYAVALFLAALVGSGPIGVSCAMALGLALLLSHPDPARFVRELRASSTNSDVRHAAAFFVLLTLAISAALGANLRGLQYAFVDVWAEWLGSMNLLSPRGGLLLVIAMYELPALLLALGRLLYAITRRERTDIFLSLWAMISLLLGMFHPAVGLPRMVVALVPIYLLAARSITGTSFMARAASLRWQWIGGVIAMMVPTVVAMILLNRSTVLAEPIPQEYVYGEIALVMCSVVSLALLLNGKGRGAVLWYVVAALSLAFWVHTTSFLNYRMETSSEEIVVGQQVSPQLREAAVEGAYYSTFFNAPLTVDPQLRIPLEWYLRNAASVSYGVDSGSGLGIALAQGGTLPGGSERAPGLYSPSLDPGGLSWQSAWSWAMARSGLVRPNPRDIILRIPLGIW